jgi:hypothetical protein
MTQQKKRKVEIRNTYSSHKNYPFSTHFNGSVTPLLWKGAGGED